MNQKEEKLTVEDWINRFRWFYSEDKFRVNKHGELCQVLFNKELPLANFFIIPLELVKKVSKDTGDVEPYKYVFIGVVRGQQVLKRIEVLFSELHNSNWIKKWSPFCELYGKKAVTYKVILDLLFDAQDQVKNWIEYDTIGWHYYSNKWFYLHGGGYIGEVNEDVRTKSNKFRLKIDEKLTEKEAFLGVMEITEVFDLKLSYSLLSFLLTAIVTTPLMQTKALSPNYLLWVMGGTGLGKTTITTFFTNIFTMENVARVDAHKTLELLPNIQEQKDCVFIIDDFGTSKTTQKEYTVINKVEDVIRELGDRTVLSYDSGISKGMLLITGERFLDQSDKNESSIRRIIRVKMDNLFNQEKKSFDPIRAKNYNKYKDTFFIPTSIKYYLEWLSGKLNSTFIEDYKKDFEKLRGELNKKSNARYTDGFAHQIIAYNFYMTYATERGFITPEECISNCNKAKKVFLELFDDQYKTIFEPNVELFLETLNELIKNDEIIISEESSHLDFDRNVYGTIKFEKQQKVLKLHWETIYTLISNRIRDSLDNRTIFIGNKKIAKLLDDSNLITFNEHNTTTQYKAKNNGNMDYCRVINIKTEMIPEIMEVVDSKIQKRNSIIKESGAQMVELEQDRSWRKPRATSLKKMAEDLDIMGH